MSQLSVQLFSEFSTPFWNTYPRQITFLLNDQGELLESNYAYPGSAHFDPLMRELVKDNHIRRLFETGAERLRAHWLEKKSLALLSPGHHYEFEETPEMFYTSLPMYSLTLTPVSERRYIAIAIHSDLLPNTFEKNTGSLIYLDPADRLVGFSKGFYDFYKDSESDPRKLLGRPAAEFMDPAPLQFQQDHLNKLWPPNERTLKLVYEKNFDAGDPDLAAGESFPAGMFRRGAEGLAWRGADESGSFLTLPPALSAEESNWRASVEFLPKGFGVPFLVFGDQKSRMDFPDRAGYQLSLDAEEGMAVLKRHGFPLLSIPLADHAEKWTRFEVLKIGAAFFIVSDGKKILEYYDPDFLERGPGYLSLYLRPGYECTLKKVTIHEMRGEPPVRQPYVIVSLKNKKNGSCLLSRFQSFALSAGYKIYRGFRLQDITFLQRRFRDLESEYQKQVKKSEQLTRLLNQFKKDGDFFMGSGKWADALLSQVERLAPSTATVLIQGATGTGKEVVAKMIHEKSGFAKGPFIKVDCSTLPPTLMESELFGHERGAFTGADKQRIGLLERAQKGTLFLDEVNNLTAEAQAKLLQFLQDFKITRVGGTEPIAIGVRILCASNRNLRDMASAGQFREDLFYRIAVVKIDLPPLRERLDDLAGLAHYFLRRFNGTYGKTIRGLSAAAFKKIVQHPWPGNIRELKNAVEQAVIFCDGEEIGPQHLALEGAPAVAAALATGDRRRKIIFSAEVLAEGLKRHRGKVGALAAEWDVTRRALYYNLRSLKIDPNAFRVRPRKPRAI